VVSVKFAMACFTSSDNEATRAELSVVSVVVSVVVGGDVEAAADDTCDIGWSCAPSLLS